MTMLGPLGLEQICANCYVYAWQQPEGKVMLRCGRWDILHSFSPRIIHIQVQDVSLLRARVPGGALEENPQTSLQVPLWTERSGKDEEHA